MKKSLSLILLTPLLIGFGCKHAQTSISDVKVLHGKSTDEHPAIVRIINLKTKGTCTGTFVNGNTLLTASHCLPIVQEGRVALYNERSIESVAMYAHPDSKKSGCTDKPYDYKKIEICAPIDFAVVIFPAGTAKNLGLKTYPRATARKLEKGEPIRIFGFGPTEKGGKGGDKNVGSAVIASQEKDHYTFQATTDSDASSILPGDSGGPIFDRDGEIAAVNSGYRWFEDGSFISYASHFRGTKSQHVFELATKADDARLRAGAIRGL